MSWGYVCLGGGLGETMGLMGSVFLAPPVEESIRQLVEREIASAQPPAGEGVYDVSCRRDEGQVGYTVRIWWVPPDWSKLKVPLIPGDARWWRPKGTKSEAHLVAMASTSYRDLELGGRQEIFAALLNRLTDNYKERHGQ